MSRELLRTIEVAKNATYRNWWFYVFSLVAIGLLIASFLVPPMGVIDGSVLGAVGELFGFAALGTLIKAIDRGMDAKLQHGDTTVQITSGDEDENT